MAIPINQHSAAMAKKVVGKFNEEIPVRSGFAGFFPKETTPTLYVDVEVQRDNDTIAVDVQRYTEGNKNTFTKSTEKTYVPPFYKEDYDFARDEVYLNTVALGSTSAKGANQAIARNAIRNVMKNKKKIERAIRKQMADVLQTGIVPLKNGDAINYGRKASSIVDLNVASSLWSVAAAKPIEDLEKAMRFLRDEGNSTGSTINVIMRGDAMSAFLNNASVSKVLESRRMNRANIVAPQFDEATGMAFHGQVSAGDFNVNLWTYNEKYTDENGATKHYLASENVIVLPNDFQGKLIYGGLPYMRSQSIGGVQSEIPGVIENDYLLRAYTDKKTISSTLELTSAPLVVPFTIDKVYTMKAL